MIHPHINVIAIILAAGAGSRLKAKVPKAFVELHGKTLLEHNIELFSAISDMSELIIVVPKSKLTEAKKIVQIHGSIKPCIIIAGGTERVDSLKAALKKVHTQPNTLVLIHNVANVLATPREIQAVIRTAKKSGSAVLGRPATATVKVVRQHKIQTTLDRNTIWLTETPQVIRYDLLQQGLKIAQQQKITVTDDVQLAELAGHSPHIVLASEQNRKITTPADLAWAEQFVTSSPQFNINGMLNVKSKIINGYRIGFGQDSHRFESAIRPQGFISRNPWGQKKPLILGGVRISEGNGLTGNSDADVILHAMCNALSSAMGGGSLSTWSDAMCKGGITDSRAYLREILKRMRHAGFCVVNISIGLEAGKPKLERELPRINQSVAKLLWLPVTAVGTTVTSGEGLTSFGRGEGIQCFVVVLLQKCRI